MNKLNTKLRAEFGPETRFELKPAAPAPFRAIQETEFERLKNRLVTETLLETAAPDWNATIRRVANEAAALAWVTFYPLLVFPALFQEKLEQAVRHAERQARILAQGREMAVV